MPAKKFTVVRTITRIILMSCLLAIIPVGFVTTHTNAQSHSVIDTIPKEDFYRAVDKLWVDHITWTRLYIVSTEAGLKDKDFVIQRLLENQVEVGDVIEAFYGDDAGHKLTELLNEHVLNTIDVIEAAKGSDASALNKAKLKWYANADKIAVLLSTVNAKEWPLASMKKQLKRYLDLTLQQAQDRLDGNYPEDIKDYDRIHEHILELADVFSEGVINQFPDRFSDE